MRTRPLRDSDIPTLRELAQASGYPYPDLAGPLEAVVVLADDEDQPVMAVAAKRLVELYLWCGKGMTPHENIAALRLLHEGMMEELKAKGYDEVNAFLPPQIAGKFGRRLVRTFGWVKGWPNWCRRF